MKRKTGLIGVIAAVVLLLVAGAVFLIWNGPILFGRQDPPAGEGAETADKTLISAEEAVSLREEAESNGTELLPGVYVVRLGGFTGEFPEDGTDVPVENAAAAYLVNLSGVSYKYLEFALRCGGHKYIFFATTLLSGTRQTVLEQSGAIFLEGEDLRGEIMNVSAFDATPSVALDTFLIRYGEGAVTVENRTDAEKKNVCVYFKRVDENGYFGGITYMVKLGAIAPGASVSAEEAHLYKNRVKVVFVTYDD